MQRLRALVADGDPDTLDVVSGAVAALPADVVRAATRQELLAALAADNFDFVVTDVAMPWLTGIELSPRGPRAPMLVMSAYRGGDLDEQLHAIGENVTLLYKPFSIEELRSALQTCLHDVLVAGRE